MRAEQGYDARGFLDEASLHAGRDRSADHLGREAAPEVQVPQLLLEILGAILLRRAPFAWYVTSLPPALSPRTSVTGIAAPARLIAAYDAHVGVA